MIRKLTDKTNDDTRRGSIGAAAVVLLLWTAFQLLAVTVLPVDAMTLRIVHTLFLLTSAFLLWKGRGKDESRPRSGRFSAPLRYSLAALTVLCFGYVLLRYRALSIAGGMPETADLAIGGVCLLLLALVGTRLCRSLTVLAGLFLLYGFAGRFLPGALGHAGFSLRRVLTYLFWGSQGVFGVAIGVSATYLFLFLLFGSLLKAGGFGELIRDLTLRAVGKKPGGPAKIAVICSGLLGMINGSAVANVATTGAFTIPLMKKTGCTPEYAAAVEAAASTGGQLTPPVMGAAAFVLAEYLGVSYGSVALAAALPAALYYLSLLLSVHLDARKHSFPGVKEPAPPVRETLRTRGHLLLPPILLIALLCFGFTPLFSAAAALAACVLAAQLSKHTRLSLRAWIDAFLEGAQSAVSIGVCTAVIGIIIGMVSLTGLGLTLGSLLLRLAEGGSLLLCGVVTMLFCTVLGMGVPGVAAYVIVSSVAAPALIKAGSVPMAAHLFCLYYACLSNLTPPVAMSALTAAGLAGADRTKTAFLALRLGFAAYLLPFFFLGDPTLLLGVSSAQPWLLIRASISACVGMLCLSAAAEGQLLRRCSVFSRLILLIAAFCCIDTGLATDLLGFGLLLGVFLYQYFLNKKGQPA